MDGLILMIVYIDEILYNGTIYYLALTFNKAKKNHEKEIKWLVIIY